MRRFTCVGLSLAALVAAGGVARAESAKEVIQKAVEAHGGADTIKKYPAGRAVSTGRISAMGLEIEVETDTVYQLPDKAKNVLKTEALGQKATVTQIANGGKFKAKLNDDALPLTDAQKRELKEAIALQSIQNLLPLLDEKAYELSLIENADKVGGKEVVGVLVKAKGVRDVKLFFDKTSNVLVKIERRGLDPTGKEAAQEMILSGHKKFDGILRPTKVEVFVDGKKLMESEVTSYKHLEKVDPKEFDVSD